MRTIGICSRTFAAICLAISTAEAYFWVPPAYGLYPVLVPTTLDTGRQHNLSWYHGRREMERLDRLDRAVRRMSKPDPIKIHQFNHQNTFGTMPSVKSGGFVPDDNDSVREAIQSRKKQLFNKGYRHRMDNGK